MIPRGAASLAALLLLAACATPSGAPVVAEAGSGLTPEAETSLMALIGEPPTPGSPDDVAREIADDAASTALAALQGSDRWMMATAHAELRPSDAAQHFDCALGARFAARPRPALVEAMTRLTAVTETLSQRLARAHPRRRPIYDPARDPCQVVTDQIRQSPTSWPSSGAAAGAAYGELFAHLAPDRAEAARRIGAELGHSRAVCAINWPSDVRAGQQLGVAAFEILAADPAFQTTLEAARAEVIAARAEGLSSPACAAERRLFGTTVSG